MNMAGQKKNRQVQTRYSKFDDGAQTKAYQEQNSDLSFLYALFSYMDIV